MKISKLSALIVSFFALTSAFSPADTVTNYPGNLQRAKNTDLRVLSYNILAQCWNRHMRHAEERAADVIEIIRNTAPDTAGLQELDPIWYKLLDGKIEPWKFARDPYDSNMCAVIYDSRRFRQIDGGVMKYTDLRIRCLRWTLLEEIKTQRKLLITNTHWDLTVPKRMANSQLMIQYITELKKRFPGVPVICTGDFNSTVGSGELKQLLQQTNLPDSVESARKVENNTFCSYVNPQKGVINPNLLHIDHILVPATATVLSAKLLYSPETMRASDHLPLLADIILAAPAAKSKQ